MSHHYPVIIIGGGQSGLSMSYCLGQRGIDHLLLEKHRIAHAWRSQRWDSFCLVTPNWQCQLPGFPYPDDDPQGFMQRDEIVGYIEGYAASFGPPIREGVEVLRLRRQAIAAEFELTTSAGDFTADHVVVAIGGYHQPKIPRIAERLPRTICQLHSSEYMNPQSLAEGAVLVIGTGQSGCQIAEDLHLAGRRVHLCVGKAPRSPRRYRGRDVVDWLDGMGHYDLPIDQQPKSQEEVRRKTNHYVTGRGGGREIDLRHFAREGMQLHGRLSAIEAGLLQFEDDLKENLDQADAAAERIKASIDQFIEQQGIDAPLDAPYEPVWQPGESLLSLDYGVANITTVIWAVGYSLDFGWVEVPVFDGKGYPSHERGVTSVPGLYFLGLPWLYTWGSGRFSGVARDAEYLARCIGDRHGWRRWGATVGARPLITAASSRGR
jgi:putative flavoprotein involved in K+ transport